MEELEIGLLVDFVSLLLIESSWRIMKYHSFTVTEDDVSCGKQEKTRENDLSYLEWLCTCNRLGTGWGVSEALFGRLSVNSGHMIVTTVYSPIFQA